MRRILSLLLLALCVPALIAPPAEAARFRGRSSMGARSHAGFNRFSRVSRNSRFSRVTNLRHTPAYMRKDPLGPVSRGSQLGRYEISALNPQPLPPRWVGAFGQ